MAAASPGAVAAGIRGKLRILESEAEILNEYAEPCSICTLDFRVGDDLASSVRTGTGLLCLTRFLKVSGAWVQSHLELAGPEFRVSAALI